MKTYAALAGLLLLGAQIAQASPWEWRRHEAQKERKEQWHEARHEEKVREERKEQWHEARQDAKKEARHDAWVRHEERKDAWQNRHPAVVTTTPVVASAPVVRPVTTRPYLPRRF